MTEIEQTAQAKKKKSTTRRHSSQIDNAQNKHTTNKEQTDHQQSSLRSQQTLNTSKKERDYYRDMFDCAPIAYFSLDEGGLFEEVNHMASQLLGLERRKLLGKSFASFIKRECQERFKHYLQKVISGENKLDIELVIRNRLGSETDVCIQSISGLGSGNKRSCRSVITDTSTSKCIERELTQRRDIAEGLIEVAPTIMLVLDTNGKIVQVNKYFEQLSGYKENEIIGKEWISTFIPANDQNRIRTVFSKSVSGIQTRGTINNILTINGEERTIEWFNTELKSEAGKLSGILATGRDITDYVEAQERQRESEHNFNLISDALPVFIAYFDTSLHYLSHNKHHQSWFDLPDDQINGKHLREVFGDVAFQILQPLINTVLNGDNVSEVIEMQLGNKGKCHFLVNFIPNINPQYKLKGFFALMTDFTDIKKQELDIKQRLMALSRDSRLILLGEMVSEIAHELNQPLTVISNYCDASLRLIKTGKDQALDISETLTDIHTQAIRASHIIKHIRQFTQLHELQMEKIASIDLISDVVQLVVDETRHRGIKINLDLCSKAPMMTIDRVLIQQVIINLIENALDAMSDANMPNRILTIHSYLTTNENVAIEVADTGLGLIDVTEQQIFKPFFTTKSKGMGLGLSISRSIVESHQGSLTLRHNIDTGTVFKIELPV